MGLVALENLSPGMVLERDVTDRGGRLLIDAGTALNDKHLHIMRIWGVVEADISGIEDTPSHCAGTGIDPDVWAAAEAEVRALFQRNDPEHPAIMELMRICTLRKAGHAPR